MQIRISLPIVAAGTIAILLTGCTVASRKAHHGERADEFFKAGGQRNLIAVPAEKADKVPRQRAK